MKSARVNYCLRKKGMILKLINHSLKLILLYEGGDLPGNLENSDLNNVDASL